MSQAILDNQALSQFQLNLYLSEQSQRAAEYEIDSVDDLFGTLYRVWGGHQGINLLGTFYQNLDGFWISQPCNTKKRSSWATDIQAVTAILNA
ncbi:MAG TPA: hypothetical protein DCY88_10210 [Cyanobacteria bacterium UBA11372]|nr:hypothetical protein [Cyanobacteria bacterium UBA11372]